MISCMNDNKKTGVGKTLTGIVFIFFGLIFLADNLEIGIQAPYWLTSWPMFLVAFGFISGIRHQFRRPGAYFMIGVGGAFLAERIIPGFDCGNILFPVVLLAVGLYLMLGRKGLVVK